MRFTWALVSVFGVLAYAACGDATGPDPFADPSAATGGSGGVPDDPGGEGGRNTNEDPSLGGPCLDADQCDDGIDCTLDGCDLEIKRCRHQAEDVRCDDGVYCNGSEVCDRSLGCRAAAVPACSDDTTCTIDTCVEETQSCRHEPRDGDGDGDPVRACGGGDCRDDDPLVSSEALERCGNMRDDDCDGDVDETGCTSPEYDRCGDALPVEEPGAYTLSLAAAAGDYAFSCAQEGRSLRDVVVAVRVPEGDPVDVDIIASVPSGTVLLAAREPCGSAAGEIGCEAGVTLEDGGAVARLVVRSPEPGHLAVLVAGSAEVEVLLKVAFRASEPAPSHETCGTARLLETDVVERVTIAGVATDHETECSSRTGELVYYFDLEETRDVRVRAASLQEYAVPVLSLRNATCSDLEDEITCRSANPTELFDRALPAGRYYVALSGTAPYDAELVLETEPPSVAPPDEGCGSPPEIVAGETAQISLYDHEDAVRMGCRVGAPDAARRLELDERSDVLVVQTGSDGDRGAVLISEPACATEDDELACRRSNDWPVRAVARGVGPGSVRAVVETSAGNPTTLTAFVRPAVPTVLVHRADDCSDAFAIPETGGRFEGNTHNAAADYGASCDYGGQPPTGAPEQLLAFTVTQRRRMVFDLLGSDYDTLMVVRSAANCPGSEISGTCSLGTRAGRSYLDLVLDPGDYYLQIDGWNGASGAWTLEVFSAEL